MKLSLEIWKGRFYMLLFLERMTLRRDILSFFSAKPGFSAAKIRSMQFDLKGILLDAKCVTVREGRRDNVCGFAERYEVLGAAAAACRNAVGYFCMRMEFPVCK